MSPTTTKRVIHTKRLATKRRPGAKAPVPPNYLTLPIGSKVPGGIFAGVTYADGQPWALVLGPEHPDELAHDQFADWMKTLSHDGCIDFVIPSKLDGMILWTNLRKEFKQAIYWLEQHAEDSGHAWYQHFSTAASTAGSRTSSSARVPSAEFRSVIQPFNHSVGLLT